LNGYNYDQHTAFSIISLTAKCLNYESEINILKVIKQSDLEDDERTCVLNILTLLRKLWNSDR